MTIKQLDSRTAAQIAAGEVVERPASVVKELVENSIDAGATQITVELQGRSTKSIRVSDNGSGIPPDQLLQAFQRHSTSKLQQVQDLQTITTLGFRGEALPSIAAVSQVTCQSRTADADTGARIILEFGQPKGPVQPFGCPPGTTIHVSDLFDNTPVRRRFLRTNNTEMNHVQQAIARYAMAQPDIRFSLATDGRRSLETQGNGSLLDCILAVYDQATAQAMLQVNLEQPEVTVQGYTATTEAVRSSRAEITTLVNGRWVRDRDLAWAVEQGYNRSLPQHRHPVCVLNISIPTHLVDINCHPTKQEVRFRHPSTIFTTVRKAVETALNLHSPARQVRRPLTRPPWPKPPGPFTQPAPTSLSNDWNPDINQGHSPTNTREQHGAPTSDLQDPQNPNHLTSDQETRDPSHQHTPQSDHQVQRQGEDTGLQTRPVTRRDGERTRPVEQPEQRPEWHGIPTDQLQQSLVPDQPLRLTIPQLKIIGQSNATYIIADHPQGLCLIDQHAAHERVIFDRLLSQTQDGTDRPAQHLLQPLRMDTNPQQDEELQQHLHLLTMYGFAIQRQGQNHWTISAVPASLRDRNTTDAARILDTLIQEAAFESITTSPELAMAATIACHSAVRAGDNLDMPSMEHILAQLAQTPEPNTCPHGRPTTLQLRRSHIEMEFRRR